MSFVPNNLLGAQESHPLSAAKQKSALARSVSTTTCHEVAAEQREFHRDLAQNRPPTADSCNSSHIDDPVHWSAGSAAGEPTCLSPTPGAVRTRMSTRTGANSDIECRSAAASTDPPLVEAVTTEQLQFLHKQRQDKAKAVLKGLMQFQAVMPCVVNGIDLNCYTKPLAPLGQVRFPGGSYGGAKRCRSETGEDAYELRCVQPSSKHRLQLPRGHGERFTPRAACSSEDLTQLAIRVAEEEVLAALIMNPAQGDFLDQAAQTLSRAQLAAVPAAVLDARSQRLTAPSMNCSADNYSPCTEHYSSTYVYDDEVSVSEEMDDGDDDVGVLFQGTMSVTSLHSSLGADTSL